MITVVPTTEAYALAVADTLREDNVGACTSQSMTPREAALWSLKGSTLSETALVDGEPAAIWGVVPTAIIGLSAMLWFMPGALSANHKLVIGRTAKRFADRCQRTYSIIECYVDDRHAAARRMMEWLAFQPELRIPLKDTQFTVYRRR